MRPDEYDAHVLYAWTLARQVATCPLKEMLDVLERANAKIPKGECLSDQTLEEWVMLADLQKAADALREHFVGIGDDAHAPVR